MLLRVGAVLLIVLTTTGFGDFTSASAAGRALAVIEMLTGQLHLVTVIGLLIGDFARQAAAGVTPAAIRPAAAGVTSAAI